MYIVYSVIKVHRIICTRQVELGNEAKLITLNNKPRLVATDFRLHYSTPV